jgi:hypothetical protein
MLRTLDVQAIRLRPGDHLPKIPVKFLSPLLFKYIQEGGSHHPHTRRPFQKLMSCCRSNLPGLPGTAFNAPAKVPSKVGSVVFSMLAVSWAKIFWASAGGSFSVTAFRAPARVLSWPSSVAFSTASINVLTAKMAITDPRRSVRLQLFGAHGYQEEPDHQAHRRGSNPGAGGNSPPEPPPPGTPSR